MIRLFGYVAIVAGLTVAAVWFARDPGTVVLIWRGWRLDTSVGLAFVGIIAAAGLAFGLVWSVSAALGAARGLAAGRRARRTVRGLDALADGFAAIHGGQPNRARKLAADAAALLDHHPATQVLAARAASLCGDAASARAVAMELTARPATELSGLRELADRATAADDLVGALESARRALARKDAPKWALDVVLDAAIAQSRWSDALQSLDSKVGRLHYNAPRSASLRANLLTRLAAQLVAQGQLSDGADAARKAVACGGGAGAVAVLARALNGLGKSKKAAAEIERAWPTDAGTTLLEVFRALVPNESALEWAKRVEKLAGLAPDHAESRLAVAAASLDAELWGQARNRLMPLLGDDVAPEIRARAAALMAALEQAERGDSTASIAWLKRAMASMQTPASPKIPPRSVAELLERQPAA